MERKPRAPRLRQQLVLYADFLGFREAMKNKRKKADLLRVLMEIAGLRGDFKKTIQTRPDGTVLTTTELGVASFSDHVVLSYELPDNAEWAISYALALSPILRVVGFMAAHAISNGMLLRGGLTYGSLYHKGGVVFGEAMVEAHFLESKVAQYPRIAIAPSLVNRITKSPLAVRYGGVTGNDGVHDLDYFDAMKEATLGLPVVHTNGEREWLGVGKGKARVEKDDGREPRWVREMSKTIEQELARLDGLSNALAHAKWMWFKTAFEARVVSKLAGKGTA